MLKEKVDREDFGYVGIRDDRGFIYDKNVSYHKIGIINTQKNRNKKKVLDIPTVVLALLS